MERCCPKNQKYQKSGANYNHFRTWQDFSISQVSCGIKIVIENFIVLGSKFLQHTSLFLPSTELFLHLVTTLGSSSHSARGRHRAQMLLHNHMLRIIQEKKINLSYVKRSCVKAKKKRKHNDNCKRRYKQMSEDMRFWIWAHVAWLIKSICLNSQHTVTVLLSNMRQFVPHFNLKSDFWDKNNSFEGSNKTSHLHVPFLLHVSFTQHWS